MVDFILSQLQSRLLDVGIDAADCFLKTFSFGDVTLSMLQPGCETKVETFAGIEASNHG